MAKDTALKLGIHEFPRDSPDMSLKEFSKIGRDTQIFGLLNANNGDVLSKIKLASIFL